MGRAARSKDAVPQWLLDYISSCQAKLPKDFHGLCTYSLPFGVISVVMAVFCLITWLSQRSQRTQIGSGGGEGRDKGDGKKEK
eukprot:CAMPEP_0203861930 /NCGR_PEP_ID=MMETSP0359-20131031/13300_1 /ASSEMBLY_ACC=CAM_ASM_000338 /TAXON_ID=268821 /ORGANISM="Scrippsiella Hangoei, Strain SHTV-5" /LENGTH=82 /DNA_ID=CAMNT_0050779251 /DNA_START=46 /DNA_END=294 /DNA_ORIENTATION=+